MAEQKPRLKDPVEADGRQQERDFLDEATASVDIANISIEDFQAVKATAAKKPHPFEGYPLGKDKDIVLGTYTEKGQEKQLITKTTYIVALAPSKYVPQDPSGKNVSMFQNGVEHHVTIPTSHSRVVRDEMGRSVDVVFDRILKMSNGELRYAIVPDHLSRSQLVFNVEPKTGGVQVNRDILLLDKDQVGPLRRVFNGYYYQQTQAERAAKEFDEAQESKG